MTELILAPKEGQANNELVARANAVVEAMIALRAAYASLHEVAQTDGLRQWCLSEQAAFYSDKSLILSNFKREGLEALNPATI